MDELLSFFALSRLQQAQQAVPYQPFYAVIFAIFMYHCHLCMTRVSSLYNRVSFYMSVLALACETRVDYGGAVSCISRRVGVSTQLFSSTASLYLRYSVFFPVFVTSFTH